MAFNPLAKIVVVAAALLPRDYRSVCSTGEAFFWGLVIGVSSGLVVGGLFAVAIAAWFSF